MSEPVPRWQVAIIGAGPSGLCTAIRLAESGRRDFVFKNPAGKIATQLPQTSLWYTEHTKELDMKEYEIA